MFSDIFISGPQYVEKGHPIRLTCNVNGTLRPPDDIDWFQKGVKLKNNPLDGIYIRKYLRKDAMTLTSQLKITESDATDTGTYICRSSKEKITTHYLTVLNCKFVIQRKIIYSVLFQIYIYLLNPQCFGGCFAISYFVVIVYNVILLLNDPK